jgi:hypothetical protein
MGTRRLRIRNRPFEAGTPTKCAETECKRSEHEVKAVGADVLAQMLGELLHTWTLQPDAPRKSTSFDGPIAADLSLPDFAEVLATYTCCSAEAFVFALAYVDRLVTRKAFVVTARNAHRLLLTAATLATKFHDGCSCCTNRYCSMVGGIDLPELNLLERRMIKFLHYRLYVTPTEFDEYHACILNGSCPWTWTRVQNRHVEVEN